MPVPITRSCMIQPPAKFNAWVTWISHSMKLLWPKTSLRLKGENWIWNLFLYSMDQKLIGYFHISHIQNRSFLHSFLNMSYMYYSVFGSIVTVLVGCIVSLFTNTEGYDSTLVHPTVSRFVKSKSELPTVNDEKPRREIFNQLSATDKQREKF